MWVLDTSVAVGWFFTDEPLRTQALAVRERLRHAPKEFAVPHLFHAEIVHVLARKSRRDARFVATGLDTLIRLGLRTLPLTDSALQRTAHLACLGLSGYDATFVALAEDINARWLTADEPAAKLAGRNRAQTLRRWAQSQH